jgi:SsrA-binding protein
VTPPTPRDPSAAGFPPRRPRDTTRRVVATNRKARHDYAISHTVEAGLALLGSEVKSMRQATPSLQDGYARLESGELWLYGVHVPPLPQASYRNHEPVRRRKCLVHRRELRKLESLTTGKGTTIVPLAMYFVGSHVKVELAVGRGKRFFDKREDIKRREADREQRRAVRRG